MFLSPPPVPRLARPTGEQTPLVTSLLAALQAPNKHERRTRSRDCSEPKPRLTRSHMGSLLALALGITTPVSAHAAPKEPTQQDHAQQKPAQQKPAHLVFMCLRDADRASVEHILEALRAELVDLPASISANCSADPGSHPTRVDHALSITNREDAIAAMWIEREGDELIAYYLDPTEISVRTRRIKISTSETAHLDTLAVITRSTLDALLRARAGRHRPQPLAKPLAKPPQPHRTTPSIPAHRPTEAPSRSGQLRLLIGYTGNRYAPSVPWQSGLDLAISYLWPSGGYTGAAYLVTAPVSLDPYPLGANDLILGKIRRRPATLFGGYQRLRSVAGGAASLGLEAEFGITLDVMAARTPVVCVDDSGDFCETRHELTRADPVLLNLGFAPRVRLLIEPTATVLLYLGAGIDLLADQKIYAICSESAEPCTSGVLFTPYNFRPVAQLGLIFRL